MKKISDPARLRRYMENGEILRCFGCDSLQFQLVRYEKGEFLTEPHRPLEGILFVVEGSVRIYNIREDGSQYAIDLAQHPALLGDMEFCLQQVESMYSEAMDPVLCVYLPFKENRKKLEEDPVFLRFMLRHMAEAVATTAQLEISSATLEEKLLFDLRHRRADHTLYGVSEATDRLHCSRRQLQRVLQSLCRRGVLEKLKKGTYRLAKGLDSAE